MPRPADTPQSLAPDMTPAPHTLRQFAAAAGVSFGTSGVRGKVADISPALCHAYTQGFLRLAGGPARRVLIGHDLRPSSPAIAAACGQSARQGGWEPVNAGVLPTPALAFAAQELGCPAIMVTGSHIPFDRNGLKFYHARGEITKADEEAILASALPQEALGPVAERPAEADPAILDLYLARYRGFFPADALAGWRIGVFEHSSVARDLLHTLLRALGAETVSLGRSDGFVAIDTEAVRPEDVAIAPVWAGTHGLDAIVTTDGDADRPLVADERGRWMRGDVLGILCARELGARSVVTPVSSNTALEASGLFPAITRTRIGSPHVIAAMEEAREAPIVGYEANGGFLLGSDVTRGDRVLKALCTRDAVLPMLLVLTAARRRGGPLSQLAADLPPRFTASDRLADIDRSACLRLLEALEADAREMAGLLAPQSGPVAGLDRTDGLRVRFANGDIVHTRLSGNAPELRCYAEAATQEAAERLCADGLTRIRHRLTAAAG